MSIEEIFQTMRELVAEQFALEPEEVTMDTAFEEDLGADSVDLVELVMAIEEEFEVGEIQEEDLSGLKTVGDTVNYIASKVKQTYGTPRLRAGFPFGEDQYGGSGEKTKLYLPQSGTAGGGIEPQLLCQ